METKPIPQWRKDLERALLQLKKIQELLPRDMREHPGGSQLSLTDYDNKLDGVYFKVQDALRELLDQPDKDTHAKDVAIGFVESLRAYEHESGNKICHDDRTTEELFDIHLSHLEAYPYDGSR